VGRGTQADLMQGFPSAKNNPSYLLIVFSSTGWPIKNGTHENVNKIHNPLGNNTIFGAH
jgi:hypothetical protein